MTPDRDTARLPSADYLRQVPREDRLADKVAELLKKAVLSGQLEPGDRLPPERVLGERLGVSRTVVREAIRSLVAKGLVEVRSGSGSVVARVRPAGVVETMQLFLRGASIDADAVDEVRTMLEVHVAGVAARLATDDDLRAMRGAMRAMAAAVHDHEQYAAQDAEFHRCIARAARNPLYTVLLDAIADTALTARRAMLSLQAESRAAIRGHERILERIAARDVEGASEEMRLHLADFRRVWGRTLDAPEADPLTADREPPR